jgi:hypothetical protein
MRSTLANAPSRMHHLLAVLKVLGTVAALAAVVACALNAQLGWRWFGGTYDSQVAVVSLLAHVATVRFFVLPWLERLGVGRMTYDRKRAVLAVPFAAWLVCLANDRLDGELFGRYDGVALAFSSLALGLCVLCVPISLAEMERGRRGQERAPDP